MSAIAITIFKYDRYRYLKYSMGASTTLNMIDIAILTMI